MRLVINIPDSTLQELKTQLTELTRSLSAHPELVRKLHLGDRKDAAIQAMFTPERLAKIDAAQASIRAGKGRTLEHLDQRLDATRSQWLAENPS